jgi:hypothetical protein
VTTADDATEVVWLVFAYGVVYDQGVYLVARTREEAEAFCATHSPDRDGYHDWRIESHTIGHHEDLPPRHSRTGVSVEDPQRTLGGDW